MTTYTLTNQIQGFVVIGDKIHDAKIIGITSDEKLVVIFDSGVSIRVRRVEEAFSDKLYAEATLNSRLSDRKLIERLDAEERERQAVVTGT
jgi:hypothetical protein